MNATQQKTKNIVLAGFIILAMLINAGLTAGFGATYGAETFPTAVPGLSMTLGALMLIVFYDGGALAWFLARNREGQSTTQRSLATILSVASMISSTLVSCIQLALTTTLVDLSAAHGTIGLAGLVLATTMAAAHFAGIYGYQASSPESLEQDAESELQASVSKFRIDQKKRVATKMMQQTRQLMDQQVDTIAQGEAAALWSQLLTEFGTSNQINAPADDGRITIDHEDDEDNAPTSRKQPAADTTTPDDDRAKTPTTPLVFVNGHGRNGHGGRQEPDTPL